MKQPTFHDLTNVDVLPEELFRRLIHIAFLQEILMITTEPAWLLMQWQTGRLGYEPCSTFGGQEGLHSAKSSKVVLPPVLLSSSARREHLNRRGGCLPSVCHLPFFMISLRSGETASAWELKPS